MYSLNILKLYPSSPHPHPPFPSCDHVAHKSPYITEMPASGARCPHQPCPWLQPAGPTGPTAVLSLAHHHFVGWLLLVVVESWVESGGFSVPCILAGLLTPHSTGASRWCSPWDISISPRIHFRIDLFKCVGELYCFLWILCFLSYKCFGRAKHFIRNTLCCLWCCACESIFIRI